MSIIKELEWRGAINQQTDAEGLAQLVEEKSIALYCGVDPTGDSLHIGHLIPFVMLKRFQDAGHKPIIVIGGGTGMIGDPSGRSSERNLQSIDQINANAEALSNQMRHLFDAGSENGLRMVNNYDWLKNINFLEFLRDYGKDFNINNMLAKDSVKSRLEDGISFTEFTYQIIQAMDFHHLYVHEDVQLQVGGADQWGNITAGLDLIRKKEGHEAEAYGLTIPLLTKADGTKFGKSAGNAIWLDPDKTSPYEFYQFWLNQDDADVIKFLKYFTFLSKEEIDELAEKVATEPHLREAQRTLAEEMTRFVHSEEALAEAQHISQVLFSGNIKELTTEQAEAAFAGVENAVESQLEVDGWNIIDFLVDVAGVVSSRRQAREDVKNGAIYIKGDRIQDLDYTVTEEDSFGGKFIVIRRGKRKYFLVKLV